MELPEKSEDISHSLFDLCPVSGGGGFGRSWHVFADCQDSFSDFVGHPALCCATPNDEGHCASDVGLEANVLVIDNLAISRDHLSAFCVNVGRIKRRKVRVEGHCQPVLAMHFGWARTNARKECLASSSCGSVFKYLKEARRLPSNVLKHCLVALEN